MNIFARVMVSTIAAAVSVALAGAGVGAARPVGRSASDWRGDTVCVVGAAGQMWATGRDNYPGATVFLTIYDNATGAVVAGPVGDRSLHVTLPHGSYYANYYVATTDLGAAQVDSPVVTV
jgi:hypothetical protein